MSPFREAPLATWGRRFVTIPSFTLLCACLLAALPVVLPMAALVDAVRGRDLASARCLLFFALYLCCEVAGIAASFALWLMRGPWTGRAPAHYEHANFTLQRWWARTLYHGAERIFGMRTEIQGADAVRDGPFLLLLRHASVGDTLLPAVFISDRNALHLRYIMKRELLWDPCLDVVGHRLPNYFVRRGSGEVGREVEAMRSLMQDLGPRDGVLLYPEGTRFTREKRERILARLAGGGDPTGFARAAALRHVLPPRLGGALALLERAAHVDVVFCAHAGFEGAGKFKDLVNGSLVRQRIRMRFWRIPAEAIPAEPRERADWLYENWQRIDDWLAAELGGAADRTGAHAPEGSAIDAAHPRRPATGRAR